MSRIFRLEKVGPLNTGDWLLTGILYGDGEFVVDESTAIVRCVSRVRGSDSGRI